MLDFERQHGLTKQAHQVVHEHGKAQGGFSRPEVAHVERVQTEVIFQFLGYLLSFMMCASLEVDLQPVYGQDGVWLTGASLPWREEVSQPGGVARRVGGQPVGFERSWRASFSPLAQQISLNPDRRLVDEVDAVGWQEETVAGVRAAARWRSGSAGIRAGGFLDLVVDLGALLFKPFFGEALFVVELGLQFS